MIKLYPEKQTIQILLPGENNINTDQIVLLNKSIRYHYTSPDAFLSIIQHKKLRFSDVRYMNDKTEGVYFLKVLLDFMDTDNHRQRYPNVQEAINLLIGKQNFERIQALDVDEVIPQLRSKRTLQKDRRFLFCASSENDALNMWNYYIHSGQYQGYNIGLGMDSFLSGFTSPLAKGDFVFDEFAVYYGEVLYSQAQQYAELEGALNTYERVAADVNFLAEMLWGYITGPGLFYKHSKFKDEKEFRIVISIDENQIPNIEQEAKHWSGLNQNICKKFYVKNGLIVPCLEVSLPADSISRITVAPGMEFNIAKQSVREILHLSGFKNVQIHRSIVPVRF